MSDTRNPYGIDLGDRNARESLRETPEAIATIVRSLGAEGFSKRTAPGKWTLARSWSTWRRPRSSSRAGSATR